MTTRQKKRLRRSLHGWLVLDKPLGMTSTQAVAMVKRILSPEKVGHAGTLDPLATGILPIALGEATKTVSYAMDGMKEYIFTVCWGEERDTDDAEGEAIQTSPARPLQKDIESRLSQFQGRISQVPPRFSAIKVQGERAYDIARSGEVIDLKPREVFIEKLELIDCPDENTAVFRCECGKGTYVRAIARDLGRLLGCFGYVTDLRRTRVGAFTLDDAITEDAFKAGQNAGNALDNLLLPVATVLDDIPALAMTERDADRLRHGQDVLLRGRDAPHFEGPAYASCQGELIALGVLEQGHFLPTRVFNLKGRAAAVPDNNKETPDVDYARAQARSC
ncbi:MAG: tRNA pseudouridine(55) synthase TruB [Pseudomonadota bacterium]